MKPEILAIIPARGGSKGLPRKNVLPLQGKPLIAYNIIEAVKAEMVDRVVVSTDDDEIAAISKEWGADVVSRPDEISGDTATSESALVHALEYLEENEGYKPDYLLFLQCTSPLTLAEDMDGCIRKMIAEKAETALAVTPFHYFLWRPDETGNAEGLGHDKSVRLRRQDRELDFLETGAIYVMEVEGFKKVGHRFFGRTSMYEMPPERVHEIDEPVDFRIAEVLLQDRGD